METLYKIKAGDEGEAVQQEMQAYAAELAAGGAEVLIAGCTEVPLVLTASDLPGPMIDATAVLAERAVAYAKGLAELPASLAPVT